MGWFKRRRADPMPAKFNELAHYNANISKGIAYTPEATARMAKLQDEYDTWIKGGLYARGYVEVEGSPGLWVPSDRLNTIRKEGQ